MRVASVNSCEQPAEGSLRDTYRPDIDGLRAIAVLSVVLYHAGLEFVSGGFVGVDIFFVISGYLITGLVVEEIGQTGTFDFRAFWYRRAKRLLPALLFVLLCSSGYAIWCLSPQRLEEYGVSLVAATFSTSNIYFYLQSGYFDSASLLKPLLHTWSLGVEGQFYLVWPVLLCLLVGKRVSPILVITAIAVISLFVSDAALSDTPEASFYQMPLRVYEFAIGALLVWVARNPPLRGWFVEGAGLLGLAMIACAVFFFDATVPFPGVAALVPCIGAALCICASSARSVKCVLTNNVLVGIGLVSYSLYLAHWPVVVFYKDLIGHRAFTGMESSGVVVGSLVVATLSYYLVEQPFRRGLFPRKLFSPGAAGVSFAVGCLGMLMWVGAGWDWRSWATSHTISIDEIEQGKAQRFLVREKLCQQKGWERCDDVVSGKTNVLIIGDSHAVDALNAFERLYPSHNYALSTLGGCPPHADIESITLPNHPDRSACKKLNLVRHDPEYLRRFDYLVINLLFAWYTPDHLLEYLKFLKAHGINKVVVFGDYLVLKRSMYELLNQYGYDTAALNAGVVSRPDTEPLLQAQVESFGYLFLSKRKVFCQRETCEVLYKRRVPFTYDLHHLSYEFSERLALANKERLDQYLGQAASPVSVVSILGMPYPK